MQSELWALEKIFHFHFFFPHKISSLPDWTFVSRILSRFSIAIFSCNMLFFCANHRIRENISMASFLRGGKKVSEKGIGMGHVLRIEFYQGLIFVWYRLFIIGTYLCLFSSSIVEFLVRMGILVNNLMIT